MLWFKIAQSVVLGIAALIRLKDFYESTESGDSAYITGHAVAALSMLFLAIGIWFFV